ncbi:MAG: ABC transporter ATP-binding protein [Bacillota bacterium]|nr:ABC transporter ATP-binding protein [Bacillota bacterium]
MVSTKEGKWMQGGAIETRALTKSFDGELAVDHLDLFVPEGSVFGLMGPNGAGKTTLIRMLMGILRPTSGRGTVLGREIADPSGEARQQVGYVADVQHMYPSFKVEEILNYCARVYRNWDWKRCRTLLKTFQLPTGKLVRALSKGMKTQLALVIALAIRPRLLILDEPAGGLDPVVRRHFMQLIVQEAATGNTTVFFSTHNLHDLERTADHVAVIMKGKLLFSRPLDELKAGSRKIQAVFPEGLPEEIGNLPGIVRVEAQGKVYSLIVGENFDETLERVKFFRPVFLELLDLDLEEIFIHTMAKEGYSREALVLE